MNSHVKLYAHEGGYAIDFNRDQWRLVATLLNGFLDAAETPEQLRLLIGVGAEEVRELIGRPRPPEPLGHVTLSPTLEQLHALHAVLTCACARARSEAAFHATTGFFVDDARALAAGIESALGSLHAR
jgi:hypothetical protein